MYHRIAKRPKQALVPHHYVSPQRFQRHVSALSRFGFESLHLTALADLFSLASQPEKRPIALTFDDGYLNFRDHAAPALLQFKQTGTVFVVAGLLGGTNEWDWRNGDAVETLLDADDLQMLSQSGFEIGSHTCRHARLTEIPTDQAKGEIEVSKRILTQVLDKDVDVFCYPYGAHNEGVRQLVAEGGYNVACSVEKGWNQPTTDRFRWKRVNVRSDTSTPILFWKLWRQSRIGLSGH